MTLREAMEIVHAKLVCGEDRLDEEIHAACGSVISPWGPRDFPWGPT